MTGELTIREMQGEAFDTSELHGFHDDAPSHDPLGMGYSPQRPETIAYLAMKLMLIVSEVGEAMEELRTHSVEPLRTLTYEGEKPVGFMSELADVVIRVGDLAEIVGGDLEDAVRVKMAYNKTRPHKHGRAV
jgi:NTP pyrophosphatase (non-canonical NTP hydrolase)